MNSLLLTLPITIVDLHTFLYVLRIMCYILAVKWATEKKMVFRKS